MFGNLGIAGVVLLAALVGFWLGKSLGHGGEEGEAVAAGPDGTAEAGGAGTGQIWYSVSSAQDGMNGRKLQSSENEGGRREAKIWADNPAAGARSGTVIRERHNGLRGTLRSEAFYGKKGQSAGMLVEAGEMAELFTERSPSAENDSVRDRRPAEMNAGREERCNAVKGRLPDDCADGGPGQGLLDTAERRECGRGSREAVQTLDRIAGQSAGVRENWSLGARRRESEFGRGREAAVPAKRSAEGNMARAKRMSAAETSLDGQAYRGQDGLAGKTGAFRRKGRKSKGLDGRQDRNALTGWAVGCPAAGEVDFFYDGGRRGILLRPDEGRLYAPAAGKVVRLFPCGNQFLFRTDFGMELLIRAGLHSGELEGSYFRPRVVQNEIVNKGKLLLEYDMEGMETEGADPSVMICVEDVGDCREVSVTRSGYVRTGEELLWVQV